MERNLSNKRSGFYKQKKRTEQGCRSSSWMRALPSALPRRVLAPYTKQTRPWQLCYLGFSHCVCQPAFGLRFGIAGFSGQDFSCSI